MPNALYLAEPRIGPNLGDTVYVVFPPGNPELSYMAEATAEIPTNVDLAAAIEAEKPEALKRLLGAIETLFPGQYYIPETKVNRVSMAQARRALYRAGLLGQVDTAIDAISDETARMDARIAWEYSTVVDRSDPLVQGLAAAFGLSEGQLDALFEAAAAL